MNIKKAIEEGLLDRIPIDDELVKKELVESVYDNEKAKKAFREEDYKWCTIQCYYSMFHAAKALLFKLGYKERKHSGIIVVLEDLNNKGKFESIYVNDFKAAISAREDADYHYIYSKESAQHMLDIAEEFNSKMKKVCASS